MERSMQALILVRGLPGTGRKLLAAQIIDGLEAVDAPFVHLDTDDFFTNAQGEYCYIKGKAGEAHRFTRLRVLKALNEENSVVVSSSFTTRHELVPYARVAQERSIGMFLAETGNTLEPTEPQLAAPILESMRKRWQRIALDGYNLKQEHVPC